MQDGYVHEDINWYEAWVVYNRGRGGLVAVA